MGSLKPSGAAIAIILSVAVFLLPLPLEGAAHRMLAVAALMAGLWISEALPLYVTALLGSALAIILVPITAGQAFEPYFSPTVALLFGGFMLARAIEKHGIDRLIANAMIARTGNGPGLFLLGIMASTAFLSFWISNTASAALMIPIALAAVGASGSKKGSPFAKAAVIGVAFSATIGGMGTVVGTPPNAIAVADLAEAGVPLSFFEWSVRVVPFVALLIPLAWLIIIRLFPPDIGRVAPPPLKKGADESFQRRTLLVGAVAAALWMTSSLHGVPDGAVSVLAAVGLYALNALEKDDIVKIDWGVLLLVGGSLGLGAAIGHSGLSGAVGSALGAALGGQSEFVVLLLASLITVAVTAVMSNTSTAALVVPILTSLPLGAALKDIAMVGGISASINFLTPMGTPPSAMAYSSGHISVLDMAKPGIVLTLVAVAVLAVVAAGLW